jgi:flavin reductase (DIM6/NTAB) family NADH-FMN oxidoreductase RutF
MPAMKKAITTIYRPVNPSPAALITSIDSRGRPNVIALGEVFNISIRKPVIIGIAIRPATYSHGLIKESGEFVANLTTPLLVEKIDRIGSRTGRDGFDKFAEFNLTPVPAKVVKTPLIEECPVNIECRVLDVLTVGDHDLFLGEVVAMSADDTLIAADGSLKVEACDFLVYLTGSYWSLGKKIADHGFAKQR